MDFVDKKMSLLPNYGINTLKNIVTLVLWMVTTTRAEKVINNILNNIMIHL